MEVEHLYEIPGQNCPYTKQCPWWHLGSCIFPCYRARCRSQPRFHLSRSTYPNTNQTNEHGNNMVGLTGRCIWTVQLDPAVNSAPFWGRPILADWATAAAAKIPVANTDLIIVQVILRSSLCEARDYLNLYVGCYALKVNWLCYQLIIDAESECKVEESRSDLFIHLNIHWCMALDWLRCTMTAPE